MDLSADTLQQAIYYFVINRCSFSGSTLSGGFSQEASCKRFTRSSINKIEALDFANIDLYNEDFYNFLTQNQHSNALLFLVPPYYLESKSKLYGKNGDFHEGFNHIQLFNFLNEERKNRWVMTYNNCAFIRDLYKDFTIIDVCWKYSMNTTKESSEIIIIN